MMRTPEYANVETPGWTRQYPPDGNRNNTMSDKDGNFAHDEKIYGSDRALGSTSSRIGFYKNLKNKINRRSGRAARRIATKKQTSLSPPTDQLRHQHHHHHLQISTKKKNKNQQNTYTECSSISNVYGPKIIIR